MKNGVERNPNGRVVGVSREERWIFDGEMEMEMEMVRENGGRR